MPSLFLQSFSFFSMLMVKSNGFQPFMFLIFFDLSLFYPISFSRSLEIVEKVAIISLKFNDNGKMRLR